MAAKLRFLEVLSEDGEGVRKFLQDGVETAPSTSFFLDEGDVGMAGFDVMYPWGRKLLDGSKTVETRRYPIPAKYLGKRMLLLETKGPHSRPGTATVLGTVTFVQSFQYRSRAHWAADAARHGVNPSDEENAFGWSEKDEKWGWTMDMATDDMGGVNQGLRPRIAATLKAQGGIIFAARRAMVYRSTYKGRDLLAPNSAYTDAMTDERGDYLPVEWSDYRP